MQVIEAKRNISKIKNGANAGVFKSINIIMRKQDEPVDSKEQSNSNIQDMMLK